VTGEAWTAIAAAVGVVISAIAAALSAVTVARINATKTDVGRATDQASAANDAAIEARELARPTGNGYADKTINSLDRIEAQLTQLADRQVRTNAWLTRHLSDHAQNDIHMHRRNREEP